MNHPKKQHSRNNNKKNEGLKPFHPTFTPNGDKGQKPKSKNIDMHCNFCGQDGHLESKCFKKMEALEETMKKHNMNPDSSSSKIYSHGYAFSYSSFSFNATSTSSFDEWLIDFGEFYHMDMDKSMFYALNKCNTKQIFVVMIDLLVL